MPSKNTSEFEQGRRRLAEPVLPLVRIAGLLYLTGPFSTMAEVLDELVEPIETGAVTYDNPGTRLRPFLKILQDFELLKHPGPGKRIIIDDQANQLDPVTAVELWVAQESLTMELEEINSLLCGPCRCNLCCIGPDDSMEQHFFEIPLNQMELELFNLERIKNQQTLAAAAQDEPSPTISGRPFYDLGPALFQWRAGWSLILPRNTVCPNLKPDKTGCLIYRNRPEVCKRPQIFAYVLEQAPGHDHYENAGRLRAYKSRKKLLAVWDCPYVRMFEREIAEYAEICDLEPVFKKNKR